MNRKHISLAKTVACICALDPNVNYESGSDRKLHSVMEHRIFRAAALRARAIFDAAVKERLALNPYRLKEEGAAQEARIARAKLP